MHSTHQDALADELKRLRFILKKGGDVKRHFVLKFDIPLATSDATPLLDTIRAEPHWRHISITTPTSSISPSLFARPQPSIAAPPWRLLQFLHIAENRMMSPVTPPSFTLSPEDAPALREVVIDIGVGDLRRCILPWSQLSRVWLGAFSNNISDYLEVLSQCSSAEKCVFEPPSWVIRRGLSPAENVSLFPIAVQSLCIQFPTFDSGATSAMDRISTPELKELSLSSSSILQDVASDVAAIQAAERLIRRSACNITTLQLGVNNLGPRYRDLLSPILDAVSRTLLHLTLVLYDASPSYFTTATPNLPQLETLQLVTTERTLPSERTEDVGEIVGWARKWSRSITDVLSGDELDERKESVRLTYVSLMKPELGYYGLHKNPDYGRNGCSDTTHAGVHRLNEEGWRLDVIFEDQ